MSYRHHHHDKEVSDVQEEKVKVFCECRVVSGEREDEGCGGRHCKHHHHHYHHGPSHNRPHRHCHRHCQRDCCRRRRRCGCGCRY